MSEINNFEIYERFGHDGYCIMLLIDNPPIKNMEKYLWHDLTVHDSCCSALPISMYEEGCFKTREEAELTLRQFQLRQSKQQRLRLQQNELHLSKEVDELRRKIEKSQEVDWKSLDGGTVVEHKNGARGLVYDKRNPETDFVEKKIILITGYDNCVYSAKIHPYFEEESCDFDVSRIVGDITACVKRM